MSLQEYFNEYLDENAVASDVRTKHMPFLGYADCSCGSGVTCELACVLVTFPLWIALLK